MYTDVNLDEVSPFQIARIMPEDEFDETARIMVLDPLEYRIVIFEADTGLKMGDGADAVGERARELLETEGGFIVHTIEPDGSGLAAVIEVPREATPSPAEVTPGKFSLPFEDVLEDEEEDPLAYEITFNWAGERAASFVYDVALNADEPTFVAEINSDPVQGWVSWVNGNDALIAFLHPMADEEGWARVVGGAPGAGKDDPEAALADPETWVKLGELIYAVASDRAVEGVTRQTY
jgi:hypothetical protein